MTSHGNGIDPSKSDETNMNELGQEDLQSAAGGNIFGDAWDGIKDGVGWVANEAEEHPIAAVATVAGGVTGVGAVLKVISVAGSEAAAIMGVSTGNLILGAAAETAASITGGAAVGGIGDVMAQSIEAKKS
ncbi:hypothetical protein [Martelella soudanensis]|uniref:hypothetical protein n=1 Tax=unclassified Martelella TaxID=2629616 RepID=UPI0015DDD502|nr:MULTISPECIES: hypothetical protein [unclassified Martelella]